MAAIKIVRDDPVGSGTSVDRYQHGWRSGKPVEDPDKLKRWGFIAAKPSEYLVCTRRGEIDRRRSGQGMRIFKWPWDAFSIAIVPTTLQRIEFVADQITRERVGVEITGVAVYRITEPEIAFRVLNFTYGEAASEKLGATLREMFVGAARRLVANLSLDECLTRRKETIAKFLMEEIAPVVGGEGSLTDTTSTGWGVVIDTIEIQQVNIQSSQVFAHLQAPYRAEIAARAELAELDRARQVEERRAETDRQTREAQATAARRFSELERDRALHAIAIAEEQARAKAAAETATFEADAQRANAAHAAAVLEQTHKRSLEEQRQADDLALRANQLAAELEQRRLEGAARVADNEIEIAHQRQLAELEQLLGQTRGMRELVAALPQMAGAMTPRANTLHLTQIGDGRGALDAIPATVSQLLAVARSLGLVKSD